MVMKVIKEIKVNMECLLMKSSILLKLSNANGLLACWTSVFFILLRTNVTVDSMVT